MSFLCFKGVFSVGKRSVIKLQPGLGFPWSTITPAKPNSPGQAPCLSCGSVGGWGNWKQTAALDCRHPRLLDTGGRNPTGGFPSAAAVLVSALVGSGWIWEVAGRPRKMQSSILCAVQ